MYLILIEHYTISLITGRQYLALMRVLRRDPIKFRTQITSVGANTTQTDMKMSRFPWG